MIKNNDDEEEGEKENLISTQRSKSMNIHSFYKEWAVFQYVGELV